MSSDCGPLSSEVGFQCDGTEEQAPDFIPSKGRSAIVLDFARAAGVQPRGKAFPQLIPDDLCLSMEDHVDQALKLEHPFSKQAPLSDVVRRAIKWANCENPEVVNGLRAHKIASWTEIANQDAFKSVQEWASAEPSVEAIAGHINTAFVRRMCNVVEGWEDMQLADDILTGSRLLGDVEHRGIWPTRRLQPEMSIDEWRKRISNINKRVLRSMQPSELDEGVWKKTEEEIDRGFLGQPVDLEEIDLSKVCLIPRFGVEQGEKIRCIDDCKRNWVNKTYGTWERLLTHGVDTAASVLSETGRYADRVKGYTVDEWSAYRQRSLCKEEQDSFYIVVYGPDGKLKAMKAMSCLFGASSMVLDFNRTPELICRFAQQEFGVAVHHFFDDLWGFERSETVDTALLVVKEIHKMTGFLLAEPPWPPGIDRPVKPPKIQTPDWFTKLLGVMFETNLPKEWYVRNTEDRVEKLEILADKHLQSGTMSPAEASKARGKYQFAGSQLYGKQAAASMKAFNVRQHSGDLEGTFALSEQLKRALFFLKKTIRNGKARRIPNFGEKRPHHNVWSDAEGEGGLGACLILGTDNRKCRVIKAMTPKNFMKVLLTYLKNPIGPLEAYAALIALRSWGEQLRGSNVTWWIDNSGVQAAMIAGNSDCKATNMISSEIWLLAAELDICLWVERVRSKSNIADVPSREDTSVEEVLGEDFSVSYDEHKWPTLDISLVAKELQTVHNPIPELPMPKRPPKRSSSEGTTPTGSQNKKVCALGVL